MTERSSPGTATAMVDKIANIVSDYYDEDADGRWLKCAQHIADSLTDEAATPLEQLEQQFMQVLDGLEDDNSNPGGVSALQYALGAVRDAMHRSSHPAQAKSEPGK
jgi:hypothetical protein